MFKNIRAGYVSITAGSKVFLCLYDGGYKEGDKYVTLKSTNIDSVDELTGTHTVVISIAAIECIEEISDKRYQAYRKLNTTRFYVDLINAEMNMKKINEAGMAANKRREDGMMKPATIFDPQVVT